MIEKDSGFSYWGKHHYTVLWVAQFGVEFFFKGPKVQVTKEVKVALEKVGG